MKSLLVAMVVIFSTILFVVFASDERLKINKAIVSSKILHFNKGNSLLCTDSGKGIKLKWNVNKEHCNLFSSSEFICNSQIININICEVK